MIDTKHFDAYERFAILLQQKRYCDAITLLNSEPRLVESMSIDEIVQGYSEILKTQQRDITRQYRTIVLAHIGRLEKTLKTSE